MTLSLIQAQLQGGFSSDFDVQRAAAQVSTTEAQIPVLRAVQDAAVNRLNTLVGLPPGSRDEMLKAPQSLRPLDQQIVVAAPATVLAARPDVRAAERRFAGSISAKDAATADLFPTISLTAFFGLQGVSGLAGTTPWGIGAGLIQPILNFGRIESQIDAADARQRQAFLDYQKTVLEALEDMETALSSYVQETTRNTSLSSAVAQDRRAAELARQQYLNGFTSLLDVLVAERDLLAAEANQAASDASLRKNLVAIYTAAGGGWQNGPVQATP
jgi:multidrug efflux system outer membrane protein